MSIALAMGRFSASVSLALLAAVACSDSTTANTAGSGGTAASGGNGGAGGNGGNPTSGGHAGTPATGGTDASNATGGNGGSGAAGSTGGSAGDFSADDASAGAAGEKAAGGASGSASDASAVGTGGINGGSGGSGNGGSGGSGGGGAPGSDDAGPLGSCTTPPPAGTLLGWASVEGMGQATTNGGDKAAPVTVTTTAAFNTNAAGTAARVIYVKGNLTGTFIIKSNKTIVGLCGAKMQGHVSLSGATNVIVRNLTIVGYNCSDSPMDCSGGADAVTVGDNSHHVWFDHDDVYDGSDGNMDITSGADFVTVSYTKFHYTTARSDPKAGTSGHRFSNLIGSSNDTVTDATHLNVTFHHDWWADHVDQRMPRTRFGKIHVFNNLFTAVGNSYCSNAGFEAKVLVENNVYNGVNDPLKPDADGDMLARGNVFNNITGSMTATGTGFVPPYMYALDATANLPATLMSEVGPH